MNRSKLLTAATALLFAALPAAAQSEGGLITTIEAEKSINKKWSVSLEGNMRVRNDLKTMDRWSAGIGTSYKLSSWLKADAGYVLLYDNNREKTTYKSSGAANTWRPSYWSTKHRVYASLSASHKFSNDIKLSLRERWQYTYRPGTTTQRWDYDDEDWEDKVVAGKGKNILRSRLSLAYTPKGTLLSPYAHMELYNAWSTEKIRYTLGTDIRLSKQHSLSVYYRFDDIRHASAEDPDMHYLGIGYKIKF